jgi:hypothetical protein
MSTTSPVTNVFYLSPPAAAAATAARPPCALALRLRVLAFRWRLRLTAGEVVAALRRFGRPGLDVADAILLEQRAELIIAAARPTAGPARIIDFAAARARLRP